MSQAPTLDPMLDNQTRPPSPPEALDDEDAWAFCWHCLVKVSRTFSRPIELLPAQLRAATTCGYLLCRIADTVEDDPDLTLEERDMLFRALLSVLEDGEPPETFTRPARMLSARGAEAILATNLDRVLKVFHGLPEPMQEVCVQWTGEMVRGMSLYGHRRPNQNGLTVLTTLDDLERYCYFVAGTVGQLLTGLFCHAIDDLSDERRDAMQANAESFGLGLQMVNILKDQTDDLNRGWCFIPQSLWRAQGIDPARLAQNRLEEGHLEVAHAAVAPVFERAEQKLAQALEYTLAIPPEASGVRLFCLLPLWMAARTLVLARGNDAMFVDDAPVKISREEVARLITSVSQCTGDDAQLREQYAQLWQRPVD
jgi:farnesyl-diphosphate farnesyltransferase